MTLGTGAPPGAHGVLGFTVRVPGTDRVLNHIRLERRPGPAALAAGAAPSSSGPAPPGSTVTVVSRPEFAGSGLTVAANRGGDFRGAAGVDALAAAMLAALAAGPGPTLVSGYHPDLDRHGHLSGVDSAPWRIAAAEVDRLLARLVDGLPPDAALLVTADHGQLDVPADAPLRPGHRPAAAGRRAGGGRRAPGALPARRAGRASTTCWPPGRAVLGDAAWVRTRDEVVAERLVRPGAARSTCAGSATWW